MRLVICIVSFLFFYSPDNGPVKQSVGKSETRINIVFENIQFAKGVIQLALYDSEDSFLDDKNAAAFYSFKVSEKGEMEAALENVALGEYAIAVFHDVNENNKLETNFLGIPTEPYCFSGEGHSKWRPPYYKDAKFAVAERGINLRLRLQKWKL
ncbi:MAG: DUF2141 domain-containing protein [Bacteroidota bacterium]